MRCGVKVGEVRDGDERGIGVEVGDVWGVRG